MALTLDQIVEEAAQLPEDVLAELIERIVVARHGGIAPAVEAAWKAETSRRMAEIMNGQVKYIALAESLARASRHQTSNTNELNNFDSQGVTNES